MHTKIQRSTTSLLPVDDVLLQATSICTPSTSFSGVRSTCTVVRVVRFSEFRSTRVLDYDFTVWYNKVMEYLVPGTVRQLLTCSSTTTTCTLYWYYAHVGFRIVT